MILRNLLALILLGVCLTSMGCGSKTEDTGGPVATSDPKAPAAAPPADKPRPKARASVSADFVPMGDAQFGTNAKAAGGN